MLSSVVTLQLSSFTLLSVESNFHNCCYKSRQWTEMLWVSVTRVNPVCSPYSPYCPSEEHICFVLWTLSLYPFICNSRNLSWVRLLFSTCIALWHTARCLYGGTLESFDRINTEPELGTSTLESKKLITKLLGLASIQAVDWVFACS